MQAVSCAIFLKKTLLIVLCTFCLRTYLVMLQVLHSRFRNLCTNSFELSCSFKFSFLVVILKDLSDLISFFKLYSINSWNGYTLELGVYLIVNHILWIWIAVEEHSECKLWIWIAVEEHSACKLLISFCLSNSQGKIVSIQVVNLLVRPLFQASIGFASIFT